jgi:tetratricopeptide (TPR) repeat protein
LLKIILLPVDFIRLNVDWWRSVAEFFLRSVQGQSICPFCSESDGEEQFERVCGAAEKYANLSAFKLVCPCCRKSDKAHAVPWCGLEDSYARPIWFIPFTGLLLIAIWIFIFQGVSNVVRRLQPAITVASASELEDELPRIDPGVQSEDVGYLTHNRRSAIESLRKGDEFYARGAMLDAKVNYLLGWKADPFNGELRRKLGDCYLKLGEDAAAMRSYQKAVELDGEDHEARFKFGRILVDNFRPSEAVGHLLAVERARPDDLPTLQLLMRSYQMLYRAKETSAYADKIERLVQLDVAASLELASYYEARGLQDRALALCERALEADPLFMETYRLQMGIYLRRENVSSAEDVLNKASELQKDHVQVVLMATSLLRHHGQTRESEDKLFAYIENAPQEFLAILVLAEWLIASKRWAWCRSVLEPLAENKDLTIALEARKLLASMYLQQDQYDLAMHEARLALRIHPGHLPSLLIEGEAMLAVGMFDQVRNTVETIFMYAPGHLDAELWLAECSLREGKGELAQRQLRAVADQHLYSARPLIKLAELTFYEHAFTDCLQICEEAIARDPSAYVAHNLRILAMVERVQLNEAVELIKPLYKAHPENCYLADAYAWALYNQGDASEPIRIMTALECDLTMPMYHYHRGMIHMAMSKRKEAIASFGAALSTFDDFPGADQATRLLQELQLQTLEMP